MKEEVCDCLSVPELSIESSQDWISTKNFVPDNRTGYHYGRYWCIVERPKDNSPSENRLWDGRTEGIDKTFELCYYNDLANRFQDKKNDWVKVSHWSPVPAMPEYETFSVSRPLMLSAIRDEEWRQVYHCNTNDQFYQPENAWGLRDCSYDDIIYLSIVNTYDNEGKELLNVDFLYAVLTEKGKKIKEKIIKSFNIK